MAKETLFNTIDTIVSPLKEVFGINYFCFAKGYWNGKVESLSNHYEWHRYYEVNELQRHTRGIPNIFNISNAFKRSLHFVDDYDLNTPFGQEIIKPMKEKFNFHHLAIYFKPHLGYSSIYFLAAPKENTDFPRLLAENLHVLDDFIIYFKAQAADLFKSRDFVTGQFNYDMKHLAQKKTNNFEDKLNAVISKLQPTRYYLDIPGRDIYLTRCEAECLELLCLDSNYQVIANKLGVSRQNVQQHVDAIRRKLGVKSKKSLIEMMKKSDLIEVINPEHRNADEAEFDRLGAERVVEIQEQFKRHVSQLIEDERIEQQQAAEAKRANSIDSTTEAEQY